MDFKALNEALSKFVLDEISDELRQSYIDGRQRQLDDVKAQEKALKLKKDKLKNTISKTKRTANTLKMVDKATFDVIGYIGDKSIETKPVRDPSTKEKIAFISNITDKNYEYVDDLMSDISNIMVKELMNGQTIKVNYSLFSNVAFDLWESVLGKSDYEELCNANIWYDQYNGNHRWTFRTIKFNLKDFKTDRDKQIYLLIGKPWLRPHDGWTYINYDTDGENLLLKEDKQNKIKGQIPLKDIPIINLDDIDLNSIDKYDDDYVIVTPEAINTIKKLWEFYNLGESLRQKIKNILPDYKI